MPKAKKIAKKVSKKQVILPKKLSSLIGIALRDLRKAEKSDKYIIAMESTFHLPTTVTCTANDGELLISEQDACIICAAGSVMAFSLNTGIGMEKTPSDFAGNTHQLQAIDSLRMGHARIAMDDLEMPYDDDLKMPYDYEKLRKCEMRIPDYNRDNPESFHKAMIKFQAKLKKAGY
jgi:hypothetical protein